MAKQEIMTMKFYEDLKHLNDLDGNVELSLEGLNAANEVLELSLVTPEKMFWDGQWRSNPYQYLDGDGDKKTVVTVVKAYCCGYGPRGNIVINNAVIIYNPKDYFRSDIGNLIANDETVGKSDRSHVVL